MGPMLQLFGFFPRISGFLLEIWLNIHNKAYASEKWVYKEEHNIKHRLHLFNSYLQFSSSLKNKNF